MKWINRWPKASDLELPEMAYQALINYLSQPFDGCIQAAQTYWKEYGCMLIVLDRNQSLDVSMLGDSIRYAIQQALSYPELKESLPAGYELRLTITSDEGSGLYLLLPPSAMKDQSTHPQGEN